MGNRKIRLAMGQMLVEGGRPDANLARAEQMIVDAAHAGRDIVVLPECLDFGWGDPSARELASRNARANGCTTPRSSSLLTEKSY